MKTPHPKPTDSDATSTSVAGHEAEPLRVVLVNQADPSHSGTWFVRAPQADDFDGGASRNPPVPATSVGVRPIFNKSTEADATDATDLHHPSDATPSARET